MSEKEQAGHDAVAGPVEPTVMQRGRDDSHEALRRDAERYRWLRNSGATIHRTLRPGEERERVEVDAGAWTRRATLDEAVDAAMRAHLGFRAA